MTPLSDVEHSPDVARHAPVIPRIMTRLSNVRVRNVATVGGALAHGDPHMDLPPVAIALGARVRIVGGGGERELAVEDLLTGYYETALKANELIASLHIPGAGQDARGLFQGDRRLGRRLAGARRRGRARARRRLRSSRRAWW